MKQSKNQELKEINIIFISCTFKREYTTRNSFLRQRLLFGTEKEKKKKKTKLIAKWLSLLLENCCCLCCFRHYTRDLKILGQERVREFDCSFLVKILRTFITIKLLFVYSSIGCSVILFAGNWAFLLIEKSQNFYRSFDFSWHDNIFAKPRSKMMMVSHFPLQNDAALRTLNVILWENLVLVLVLVLESKGPFWWKVTTMYIRYLIKSRTTVPLDKSMDSQGVCRVRESFTESSGYCQPLCLYIRWFSVHPNLDQGLWFLSPHKIDRQLSG